jgi:hypothetical protein
MVHPNVTVSTGTGGRPPGASIDTGTAFIIGEAASGPYGTVQKITSLSQFVSLYGARDADSPGLYDTLDRAFQQGLEQAYVVASADEDAAGAVASGLALFNDNLGPGQVFATGSRTQADHVLIAQHAVAHNRLAVVQLASNASAAAVATASTGLRAAVANPEVVAVFGSWLSTPDGVGGTRTTPLAADALGLIARVDGRFGNSGHAAAGDQGFGAGRIVNALGTIYTRTDAEWDTLYDAGVNIATVDPLGDVMLSSFTSLSTDAMWQQLTRHRLRMLIVSLGKAILNSYLFRVIDGEGHVFKEVEETLAGSIFLPLWQDGVLYGATPQDAFSVDCSFGDGRPNTSTTVAARQLNATGRYTPSPFAEQISFQITAEAIQ